MMLLKVFKLIGRLREIRADDVINQQTADEIVNIIKELIS